MRFTIILLTLLVSGAGVVVPAGTILSMGAPRPAGEQEAGTDFPGKGYGSYEVM